MPRRRYALTVPPRDEHESILIDSINEQLGALAVELGRIQGLDGATPTFYKPLDLQRQQICNVGFSKNENDLAPRSELRERSVYLNNVGEIEAKHKLRLRGGAIGVPAKQGAEIPTLAQTTFLAQGGAGGTVTLSDAQTITGAKTFDSAPLFTADTPSQITGDQNNYALGSRSIQRLDTDASRTVTGFVAITNAVKVIVNVGSFNLVLADDSGSSSAANRILMQAGANLTLTPDQAAMFWYDGTSSRWRQIN